MHKKSVCAAVAALMVLLAGPATASVFLRMDQSELITKAAAIVDGRVIQVESFWNDEHTAIHTESVIAIDDLITGDAPATVVIRTPGGQVDDYVIEAIGCPSFEKGQRVLLFLTPDRGEAYRVLGYQQGHYMIRKNAAGSDEAVSTVDSGTLILSPEGKASHVPQTVELDTFKAELRAKAALLRDVRQ